MFLENAVFSCKSCGKEIKILNNDNNSESTSCCNKTMVMQEGCISFKKGEKISKPLKINDI